MKEDILEQIVEDWQSSQPKCFVKHNIKYKPNIDDIDDPKERNKYCVNSDIDILSIKINDNNNDNNKVEVSVFNCKSWQNGFNVKKYLYDKLPASNTDNLNRDTKPFREFFNEKWQKAFINKIKEETNSTKFTYYIVCTKLTNSNNEKEKFESIKERFKSNGAEIIEIKIITLSDILDECSKRIADKDTNYLESTEVGRLLQLIKASPSISLSFDK